MVQNPPNRTTKLNISVAKCEREAVTERIGFSHIAYKRAWPVWTPPDDMIKRQPELERWRHGQPPGPTNPLGPGALYIHQGNQDTLYRLHGTAEVWTIGKAISSGCVRLLHQDIIDLHERVRPGSTIVVLATAIA